ncbi:MAG TPA: hypothetical protein VMG08_08785 [Allosphingosinicella sp.]|nr:hypothetical protein [Allosphingosinicella sp.]
MARARERNLTDGEIALCRTIFGEAVAWDIVTLHDGPGLNPIARIALGRGHLGITLGRRIYFREPPPADFGAADEAAKVLFVHEMTHVWQYRRLGMLRFLLRYADEFFAHGASSARLYAFVPGRTRFAAATLEAQAEIVGDYSRALWKEAGPDPALAFNMAGSGLYGGL